MKQEHISPSLNNEIAQKKLNSFFYGDYHIYFPCELVEEFSLVKNGKLETVKSSKNEFLIAIVGKNHQYYIVFSSNGDVYEWGIKPYNYCFGLEQAIGLVVFRSPVNRPNVLLCDTVLNTISFLRIGVPAILVDPKTVWQDPYFTQIIRHLFSNIIITYSHPIPKEVLSQQGIKVFDLEEYLKENHRDSLTQHLWMDGLEDNTL